MSREDEDELEELRAVNDEVALEDELEEVEPVNIEPTPSTPDQKPGIIKQAGEAYESAKARVKDFQLAQKEKKEKQLEEKRGRLEKKIQQRSKEAVVNKMEDKIRKQDRARRTALLDRVRAPLNAIRGQKASRTQPSAMKQALMGQPSYMGATGGRAGSKQKPQQSLAMQMITERGKPRQSLAIQAISGGRAGSKQKPQQSLAIQAISGGAKRQQQSLAMSALLGGRKPGESKLKLAMLNQRTAPQRKPRPKRHKRGRKK